MINHYESQTKNLKWYIPWYYIVYLASNDCVKTTGVRVLLHVKGASRKWRGVITWSPGVVSPRVSEVKRKLWVKERGIGRQAATMPSIAEQKAKVNSQIQDLRKKIQLSGEFFPFCFLSAKCVSIWIITICSLFLAHTTSPFCMRHQSLPSKANYPKKSNKNTFHNIMHWNH